MKIEVAPFSDILQNATCGKQINDIKELDRSPSVSRKQYSSTKGKFFLK